MGTYPGWHDGIKALTSVLVLGGARSGKSAHAEHLLSDAIDVTYISPNVRADDDADWQARVAAHQARRPRHWRTVETADVAGAVRDAAAGRAVLVDCLGTWLTRLADDAGCWDDLDAVAQLWETQGANLAAVVRQSTADVVLVSNETGLGVIPATASGRAFRDGLGRLNAAVAEVCDRVSLVVAGRVLDVSDAPGLNCTATLRSIR